MWMVTEGMSINAVGVHVDEKYHETVRKIYDPDCVVCFDDPVIGSMFEGRTCYDTISSMRLADLESNPNGGFNLHKHFREKIEITFTFPQH